MKKRDKIQRIEYLSQEQRGVKSLLATNSIQANKVANAITADKYILQNESDLRRLLFSINTKLDESTTVIYSQVVNEKGSLSEMGIRHSTNNIQQDSKIEFYNMMGRGTDIAVRGATRPLNDGRVLSERIWTTEQRTKIYKLVGESAKAGETPFQLADKMGKYLGEDYPRYLIDRIANTELIQSYTDGKKETYGAFLDEYDDEFKVMVEIELSPFHPVPDICDAVEGLYDFEDAPDVPLHPNCICSRVERIVPVGRREKAKTVTEYIDDRAKLVEDKKIHIPKEAGGLAL